MTQTKEPTTIDVEATSHAGNNTPPPDVIQDEKTYTAYPFQAEENKDQEPHTYGQGPGYHQTRNGYYQQYQEPPQPCWEQPPYGNGNGNSNSDTNGNSYVGNRQQNANPQYQNNQTNQTNQTNQRNNGYQAQGASFYYNGNGNGNPHNHNFNNNANNANNNHNFHQQANYTYQQNNQQNNQGKYQNVNRQQGNFNGENNPARNPGGNPGNSQDAPSLTQIVNQILSALQQNNGAATGTGAAATGQSTAATGTGSLLTQLAPVIKSLMNGNNGAAGGMSSGSMQAITNFINQNGGLGAVLNMLGAGNAGAAPAAGGAAAAGNGGLLGGLGAYLGKTLRGKMPRNAMPMGQGNMRNGAPMGNGNYMGNRINPSNMGGYPPYPNGNMPGNYGMPPQGGASPGQNLPSWGEVQQMVNNWRK